MKLNDASILLVEDEPILRDLMQHWLAKKAANVLCAEDGVAALNILSGNKVDLIISDILMPNMDGIVLTRKVRTTYGRKPAVIFITGFSDVPLREAYEIGADAILEKPVSREDLIGAVERSLTEIDKLWQNPLGVANDMQFKKSFTGLESALQEKQLAFGQRGFCIETEEGLPCGPVAFSLEFKTDQRVVLGQGIVRWTDLKQHKAGVEITHVDDVSREWLIAVIERGNSMAFIPRSSGEELPSEAQERIISKTLHFPMG